MIFLVTYLAIPAMSQDMQMDMGLEPIGGQNDLFKTMLDITTTMNEEKEKEAAAAEEQAKENEKLEAVQGKIVKAEKNAAKNKYLMLGALVAVPLMAGAAIYAGGQVPEDPNQRTMRSVTALTAMAVPVGLVMHSAGAAIRIATPQQETWSWNIKENPTLAALGAAFTLHQAVAWQNARTQQQQAQQAIENAKQVTEARQRYDQQIQDLQKNASGEMKKTMTDMAQIMGEVVATTHKNAHEVASKMNSDNMQMMQKTVDAQLKRMETQQQNLEAQLAKETDKNAKAAAQKALTEFKIVKHKAKEALKIARERNKTARRHINANQSVLNKAWDKIFR